MTVQEYDLFQATVADLENKADALKAAAKRLDDAVDKLAGIEYHGREPGFPFVTHQELPGYRNTPREVIAELETNRSEKIRAEHEAALNLLAVIHGDGGQHVARVGFVQACANAEDVVLALRRK